MQDDIKDRIKSEIKATEYISFYLGHSTRGKWTCPFHTVDKTPSLSAKNFHFTCFACNENGDIFEFVQKLFNLDFPEATKKVMRDFGYSDSKPTWQERQRSAERKQAEQEARYKQDKYRRYYRETANLYRILNKQPKSAELNLYLARLEKWLDDNLTEVTEEFF